MLSSRRIRISPRVVQAPKGPTESLGSWQHRVLANLDIIHKDRTRNRRPERELILDRWCG